MMLFALLKKDFLIVKKYVRVCEKISVNKILL